MRQTSDNPRTYTRKEVKMCVLTAVLASIPPNNAKPRATNHSTTMSYFLTCGRSRVRACDVVRRPAAGRTSWPRPPSIDLHSDPAQGSTGHRQVRTPWWGSRVEVTTLKQKKSKKMMNINGMKWNWFLKFVFILKKTNVVQAYIYLSNSLLWNIRRDPQEFGPLYEFCTRFLAKYSSLIAQQWWRHSHFYIFSLFLDYYYFLKSHEDKQDFDTGPK